MIDTEAARQRITSEVPKVDHGIIAAFHQYLLQYNGFVKGFLTMKEMKDEEEAAARVANRRPKELKLLFSMNEKVGALTQWGNRRYVKIFRRQLRGSTAYPE
jgi:hypothetical protein